MQRRKFIQLAQTGLLGGCAAGLTIAGDRALAQKGGQTGGLTIEWLGHMSYLISGGGKKVLTHPFRPAGCTAGKAAPKAAADLVLVSSRLFDEGYVDNLPRTIQILSEPGAYSVAGINFQGVRTDHDRLGGRRFGTNVAWSWTQAGVRILHLGGTASAIAPEQKILMGRPDVLIVPVGGGDKGYSAEEAQAAIGFLNPRIVVPSYYRTAKAAASCDLSPIDPFLALMEGKVNRINGSSLSVNAAKLPGSLSVAVLKSV